MDLIQIAFTEHNLLDNDRHVIAAYDENGCIIPIYYINISNAHYLMLEAHFRAEKAAERKIISELVRIAKQQHRMIQAIRQPSQDDGINDLMGLI